MTSAKALGATMVRSQYPLSAYEEQLADELGMMLWSEIPVYQVRDIELARGDARGGRGAAREHPRERQPPRRSSSGRSPTSSAPIVEPGPAAYIADAVRAAHELDPDAPGRPRLSRATPRSPASLATRRCRCSGSTTTSAGIQGRPGRSPTSASLADYLAEERACYRSKAIWSASSAPRPTARARRRARTYEFQSQFVSAQLSSSRPRHG